MGLNPMILRQALVFAFALTPRVPPVARRPYRASGLDSYLRDHRQNESNIVIEAPGRSSCSQEIDDALDGGVGAVIGGFEPAVWTVLRVRPVMEAAVGEGAAQALVEEEEE